MRGSTEGRSGKSGAISATSALARRAGFGFDIGRPFRSLPIDPADHAAGVEPMSVFRRSTRAVPVALALSCCAVLLGGQFRLDMLGVRVGSFRIAGRIMLLRFARTMIFFGGAKPARDFREAERNHLPGAVFAVAMPCIASPGAVPAVFILIQDHTESITDPTIAAGLVIVVPIPTRSQLPASSVVHRLIGNIGGGVIGRIKGIVLATIAVDSVPGGADAYGTLDVAPPPVARPLTRGAFRFSSVIAC